MDFNKILETVLGKLYSWYFMLIEGIPSFILAILAVLFFGFISKYFKNATGKLVSKISDNNSLSALSATVVSYIVNLIGVFVALDILHLDKTVTSLLAGAGILGLALGFAFQDLTSNFISGVFIAVQQPIRLGDVIETNGYFGQVKSISIRSTILYNFAGQEIEIPSKDIFQKPILNYSKTGERRMQLNCGVTYDADLQHVQDVAIKAIEQLPFLQNGKPVELHYDAFSDSSINFKIWYWIDQVQAGPPYAASEAIKAIKKAFDTHDITIPFPIRTLEIIDGKENITSITNNTD